MSLRLTITNDSCLGKVVCPECGHGQSMTIPTKSCLTFYKCAKCARLIRAAKSCCVFCDFGDRKCPAAKKHKKRSEPLK